ncbi:MAG: glycosyltransferase [Nanopusillaceae archaeon]
MYISSKIDGIVINYNSIYYSDIVTKSIESFITLPFLRKLYIIDNASDDGSFEYLNEKFSGDRSIRFLRLKYNLGYAGAVNFAYKYFGLNLSKFFFIFNNDLIIINHDGLFRILRYIDARPHIALASGILLYPTMKVQTGGFLLNDLGLLINLHHMDNISTLKFREPITYVTFVSGALMLIRKSAVEYMPERVPFPSRGFMYLDDIVLGPKLWELGFSSIVVNEPVAIHYESMSLTSARKSFLLGRALAIQRKLFKPCIGSYNGLIEFLYANIARSKIAKSKEVIDAFRRGYVAGLREYAEHKHYWTMYNVNISSIYHGHGIGYIVKRLNDFIKKA